ncbi:unnamed protein product, partial [Musa textilis]
MAVKEEKRICIGIRGGGIKRGGRGGCHRGAFEPEVIGGAEPEPVLDSFPTLILLHSLYFDLFLTIQYFILLSEVASL